MPRFHPSDHALYEFLREDSDNPGLWGHLSQCVRCQGRACQVTGIRAAFLKRRLMKEADYGSVFERSLGSLTDYEALLARERRQASSLVQALLEHLPEKQSALVRDDPRLQTWGALEQILRRSHEQAFKSVVESQRLARLALLLADQLDTSRYGISQIEDMRGRAWSYIGNGHRLRYEFQKAENAFAAGLSHLRRGTQDLFERALLQDLKASLHMDQRSFQAAGQLARRAYEIFFEAGEAHRAGRSLISLSVACNYMGDHQAAIDWLRQGTSLLHPGEPRLLLCTRHNLIGYLCSARYFEEAQELFHRSLPVYEEFPDPWTQSRRHWALGWIAFGLQQYERAEKEFFLSREGFLNADAPLDFALVSLELATLFNERGRTGEARRLVEQAAPILKSWQIDHEKLTVLSR